MTPIQTHSARPVFSCTLIILLLSCGETLAGDYVHSEFADQGMVVSESAPASRIGRDVMSRGGNAVDAAVATAFALAVTWPEAGNIGGGGFMMIRPADGSSPVCIDYREKAPLSAKQDTYVHGESRHTRKIVGVPGTVRGLGLAHQRYGRLSWSDVVSPAARLAKDGFAVDSFLARSTNHVIEASHDEELAQELRRVYGKSDGTPWQAGDTMQLPDLAKTLSVVAEQGPDAFYEGTIADLLLAEMKKEGGLIRAQDLHSYEARIRQPIRTTFNGYEILGAPPPSSGGIAVAQTLNMVEALGLPRNGRFDAETIHLLAEISRRVFLDRARHLGDSDFVHIPSKLTSKDYARQLSAGVDRGQATNSATLASDIKLADEGESTTHFSVVDGDGMAVSNTYTLEASWGNRMVVPGAGFVLNNEMGDFNWTKGHTDRTGRIGTDSNLIAPGKRMLSSQCPVIVTKDNQVVLVTGSPGGRTIINTVINILLNVMHFEMSGPEAVQAKRMHHQWMPDMLYLEDAETFPHKEAIPTLESSGHRIANRASQGSAHSIWRDPLRSRMVGVADYRRGGRPAGISSLRIARWDFGGKPGTGLQEQKPTGRWMAQWRSGIARCAVDGADHFRIHCTARQQPSYLPLPKAYHQVSLTVDFDGIAFAGAARNEKLQFALTQSDGDQPLMASMTLARNASDEIVVYGEASGRGATPIAPVVISNVPHLRQPVALQLDVDTDSERFQISLRHTSAIDFRAIGDGGTGAVQAIRYARLHARNDFSAADEYVHIEAVELSVKSKNHETTGDQ